MALEPEPEPEPETPERAEGRRQRRRTDYNIIRWADTAAEPLTNEAGVKNNAARATEVEAMLQKRTGPKEAWENRLLESWRGKDGGAEIRRRAALLSRAPVFADCTNKELRMLGVAMEQMSYSDGEVLFAEGDAPNGVYVLESGACAVHVKGVGVVRHLDKPGTVFGELSIFLDTNRTASVVATEHTRCLRCSGLDAIKVMEQAWGDRDEIEERAGMLAKVNILSDLGKANLMMLATAMVKHIYHRPGEEIVREGKRGENMFFVKVGNPYVYVRNVGRVCELAPGDFFGELVVLGGSPYRTATVTTADMCTVLYSLHRDDLFRLTTPEQHSLMLAHHVELYDARMVLRQSEVWLECVDRLWEVLRKLTEQEASKSEEHNTGAGRWLVAKRAYTFGNRGAIDRNAYMRMHCNVSRVLASPEDFSLEAAEKLAEKDWYEDVASGERNVRTTLWVEKVKAKMLKVLGTTVAKTGWSEVFKTQLDDSGEVAFEDLSNLLRRRMKIPSRLTLLAHVSSGVKGRCLVNKKAISIEDDELEEIFRDVDKHGEGWVFVQDLVDYLVSAVPEVTGTTREQRLAGQRRRDLKLLVQDACREEVDRVGWMRLFAEFDSDGSGDVDLNEFKTVIRKFAKVSTKLISDENIESLFQAIDESANGRIDAQELQNFLCERPFEALMPYDTFVDSIFQLMQLWTEDERTSRLLGFELCGSDEERYAVLLSHVYERIMTPTGELKVVQQRLGGFNPKGNYELADDGDSGRAMGISGVHVNKNKKVKARKTWTVTENTVASVTVTLPIDASTRTAWVDQSTGTDDKPLRVRRTGSTRAEPHFQRVYVPTRITVGEAEKSQSADAAEKSRHAGEQHNHMSPKTASLVPALALAWKQQIQRRSQRRPQSARAASKTRIAGERMAEIGDRKADVDAWNEARATHSNNIVLEGTSVARADSEYSVWPTPPAEPKTIRSSTSCRRQRPQQQAHFIQTRRKQQASAFARIRSPDPQTQTKSSKSPSRSAGSPKLRLTSTGSLAVVGTAAHGFVLSDGGGTLQAHTHRLKDTTE